MDTRRHCVAAVWSAVDGELVAAANAVAGEELRLDWDVCELAGACIARARGAIDCVMRRPLHRTAQQEEEVDFGRLAAADPDFETRQKGR